MPSPSETVLAYIQAINRHEIGTLTNLMTPDHEFIDSLGAVAAGRDLMRQAWIAYFFMIPDYRVEVTEVIFQGTSVVVTGKASGTVADRGELPTANAWEIPIAVQADVRNGRVARWRVFADNEPVRQILNRQETIMKNPDPLSAE
jgi:ketosteroid isomerase-like protein